MVIHLTHHSYDSKPSLTANSGELGREGFAPNPIIYGVLVGVSGI